MYVFRFIIFNLNHEIYLFFKSFFFVTQRVQVKMYNNFIYFSRNKVKKYTNIKKNKYNLKYICACTPMHGLVINVFFNDYYNS